MLDAAGERGFSVIAVHNRVTNTVRFLLQHRAVSCEHQPTLQSTDEQVPVSVASQIVLQFCPWCGAGLSRAYPTAEGIALRADLDISQLR
ncbi:MAG: hypothetical protein JNK48_24165 [Bryobacterales bacterium]|nr:hypothetical protein [Bryobacterales bacterium]